MKYMKTTDAKSVGELKEKAETTAFPVALPDVQEQQQLMQAA